MPKRKVGLQLSAFPEEKTDQDILIPQKKDISIANELAKYMRKEGLYNFCKMAEELKKKTAEYSFEKYGVPPAVVFNIASSVFQDQVRNGETIASLLHKCKTIPGYRARVA